MTVLGCSGIFTCSNYCVRRLTIARHRINHAIRSREVLLIDETGTKRGTVPIQEALAIAKEAGLDLVEVAGNADPPVCKVMDYGKMAYQAKKKKHGPKGKIGLKEISFSMQISIHDIETKLNKAKQFLEKGHKLKFKLILRGREKAYVGTKAIAQLKRLIGMMDEFATIEQLNTSLVGNRLSAILAPLKTGKS